MPSPQEIEALKNDNSELTRKLMASDEKSKTLSAEIEKLKGSDLDEEDKKLIAYLCKQEQGTRYNKLEEEMGWNFRRLKHSLDKLKKLDFTKVHGGGELLNYIEISEQGVAYAVRENLI